MKHIYEKIVYWTYILIGVVIAVTHVTFSPQKAAEIVCWIASYGAGVFVLLLLNGAVKKESREMLLSVVFVVVFLCWVYHINYTDWLYLEQSK